MAEERRCDAATEDSSARKGRGEGAFFICHISVDAKELEHWAALACHALVGGEQKTRGVEGHVHVTLFRNSNG